jgi:hypothetical protein
MDSFHAGRCALSPPITEYEGTKWKLHRRIAQRGMPSDTYYNIMHTTPAAVRQFYS